MKRVIVVSYILCLLLSCFACSKLPESTSTALTSMLPPTETAAPPFSETVGNTTPPHKLKYDYIPDDGGLDFDLAALNERIHRQINADEVPPWIYDSQYVGKYLFIFYGWPTLGTMVERFDTETSESIFLRVYSLRSMPLMGRNMLRY